MDIYEALEKLTGYFDTVADSGFMTGAELDEMNEVEDTIYQFIRKYEPREGF